MHQTCIVLLAFHILPLGKLSFSFTEYNSGLVLRAFCSLNSHNYDPRRYIRSSRHFDDVGLDISLLLLIPTQ